MDLVTVLVVLGFLALGAASVYWAMSWQVAVLTDQLEDAQGRARSLEEAATRVVNTERALDRARDLPELDELRLLLKPGFGAVRGPTDGDLEDRYDDLVRGRGGGVAPLPGPEEDPGEQGPLDSLRKALGGPE